MTGSRSALDRPTTCAAASYDNADWLIAHGTYLEPDDFWQLRPEAAPGRPPGRRGVLPPNSRTIPPCARTHTAALLERGAIVCLGTDSLASAPSLSILDELRFLHRRDESLSGASAAHDGHALRRLGPSRRNHYRQPENRQVRRPGDRRAS